MKRKFETLAESILNSTPKVKRKLFTFGYDLDAIKEVEDYVRANYSENEYEMFVGHGDDVMNALEINVKKGDTELMELIDGCEGEGKFQE